MKSPNKKFTDKQEAIDVALGLALLYGETFDVWGAAITNEYVVEARSENEPCDMTYTLTVYEARPALAAKLMKWRNDGRI